jgi:hypothetical protein
MGGRSGGWRPEELRIADCGLWIVDWKRGWRPESSLIPVQRPGLYL